MLKKRRGIALGMVIALVLVLMTLFTTVAIYFNTNLDLIVHRRNMIKAYFLCKAGMELGTAALFTQVETGAPAGTDNATANLFERFAEGVDTGDGIGNLPALVPGEANAVFEHVIVFNVAEDGVEGQARITVWADDTHVFLESEGIYKCRRGRYHRHTGRRSFVTNNPANTTFELPPPGGWLPLPTP